MTQVTHPVSVTALTWYEKWWHPVTFWQFTDNKQSARNNNHRNGFGRMRPRPLTALQWQIFWMKNCVLRIPVKYVCCHKKFSKNFSIIFGPSQVSTQMFRGVFQMRANIFFIFSRPRIVCETFWRERRKWFLNSPDSMRACCNENKNFSRHRCSKSRCHLRSN